MTSSIDIQRFEQIKASGDLPSPKGAALAIIRLTQKDDTSLASLATAMKLDPAFVGRLIKAANGAKPHGRRPIVSIQDALTILGIPAVRALALGFSLLSGYRTGKCKSFDYSRYWSHSLATAVALQALTQHTRAMQADEAFSVGLLARVGELALATIFPDQYALLLNDWKSATRPADDDGAALLASEREAFVLTHTELTAAMLEDWGFPTTLTTPIRYQEAPELSDLPADSRTLLIARILGLSGHIADACLAPDALRREMMPKLFRLGSRVGIDADALTSICNRAAAEWVSWASLMDVTARPVPPFEDLALPLGPAPDLPGATTTTGTVALDEPWSMRVLLVDDDASMRAILKGLLEKIGHEVFEAANGQQGFEMALDLHPHVMIVDWLMPEMDGIELTRALRQTRIGRAIYVLILTGVEDEEKLIHAFESGVDDYMTKPLKPRVLQARLRAGQRVVRLQADVERDREEIRRFAGELAISNRRLQEVAMTDFLTGFPNRRYAMERLPQEWSASTRTKRPLSALVVDVDSFKTINDTYGHDVGDSVLKQVAAALKTGLRTPDVVCRVGGDEFLVICPDTSLDAAMLCGERIRSAVETIPIKAGTLGIGLKGSISVGVACRDADVPSVEALVKAGDQGVYLAKQRGRNCVATLQKIIK